MNQESFEHFYKIVKGCKSFDDMKIKIDEVTFELYSNVNMKSITKRKGDLMEILSYFIFLQHPNFKDEYEHVWLYNDIPINVKNDLNLPLTDKGVDILLQDKNGNYISVQVKYRKNQKVKITHTDLGTFSFSSFSGTNKITKGIFISNVYEVYEYVDSSINIEFILNDFFSSLDENFFVGLVPDDIIVKRKKYIIRSFQKETVLSCLEYYKTKNKGYINIFCGTGKTFIYFLIFLKLNIRSLIIMVPSLQLASQTYKNFKFFGSYHHNKTILEEYYDDNEIVYLIVGSDFDIKQCNTGDVYFILSTNSLEISQFIEKNKSKKIVIISTYQSSDSLIDGIKDKNIDMCIYDEAHRTVINHESYYNRMVYYEGINKKLFATATPKFYMNSEYNKMSNEEINKVIKLQSIENKNKISEISTITDQKEIVEINTSSPSEKSNIPIRRQMNSNRKNNKPKTKTIITPPVVIHTNDSPKVKTKHKVSMLDKDIYGECIYTYSLQKAIQNKHLCDYQLYLIHTNDQCISELIQNYRYIFTDDNCLFTDEESIYLAQCIMILNAFQNNEITHLVTYHNIKTSMNKCKRIFTALLNSRRYPTLNELTLFHIDGNQKIKNRNISINQFEKSKLSILCSCKTLTEGVDIPCIDALCFFDNKHSQVDIIQSIGRGLRLYKNKKVTKIFLFPNSDSSIADSTVIKVIKALKLHDSRVMENFTIITENRKNSVVKHQQQYIEKIIESTQINLDLWIRNIEYKLFDQCFEWEIIHNEIFLFIKNNEGKYPPYSFRNGKIIYASWLTRQRWYKKLKILEPYKIKMLEDLPNFKWNVIEDTWKEIYYEVIDIIGPEGLTYPKLRSKEEKDLELSDERKEEIFYANWINTQIKNEINGILSDEHKLLLSKLPNFSWNILHDRWEKKYNSIFDFKKSNNDKYPKPSTPGSEENNLYLWIFKHNKTKARRFLTENQLERIDFVLKDGEYFTKKDIWYIKKNDLLLYMENNDGKIPTDKSHPLYGWVIRAKTEKGRKFLDKEQLSIIESILGPIDKNVKILKEKQTWEKKVAIYKGFLNKKIVPNTRSKNPDEKDIAIWAVHQKRIKDTMDRDRFNILNEFGFFTKTQKCFWWHDQCDKVEELIAFLKGNLPSKRKYPSEGGWISANRKHLNEGYLDQFPDRIERLRKIGIVKDT